MQLKPARLQYTVCGTPEYMAPEVINQRGHGVAVDFWSLGVLIYEMVAGYTPYYSKSGDIMQIYRKVTEERLQFPSKITLSNEIKALISALLFINPKQRLGMHQKGHADIRSHKWFQRKGFKWGMLSEQRLPAPHVPRSAALGNQVHSNCLLNPQDAEMEHRRAKWQLDFNQMLAVHR